MIVLPVCVKGRKEVNYVNHVNDWIKWVCHRGERSIDCSKMVPAYAAWHARMHAFLLDSLYFSSHPQLIESYPIEYVPISPFTFLRAPLGSTNVKSINKSLTDQRRNSSQPPLHGICSIVTVFWKLQNGTCFCANDEWFCDGLSLLECIDYWYISNNNNNNNNDEKVFEPSSGIATDAFASAVSTNNNSSTGSTVSRRRPNGWGWSWRESDFLPFSFHSYRPWWRKERQYRKEKELLVWFIKKSSTTAWFQYFLSQNSLIFVSYARFIHVTT